MGGAIENEDRIREFLVFYARSGCILRGATGDATIRVVRSVNRTCALCTHRDGSVWILQLDKQAEKRSHVLRSALSLLPERTQH